VPHLAAGQEISFTNVSAGALTLPYVWGELVAQRWGHYDGPISHQFSVGHYSHPLSQFHFLHRKKIIFCRLLFVLWNETRDARQRIGH